LEADGSTKLGSEHLDGDAPMMPGVCRHKNGGHAALPDLALDDIATRDRSTEALEEVSHRSGDLDEVAKRSKARQRSGFTLLSA
jgi:hypothetical protein